VKTYRGIRNPDCHVLVLNGPAGSSFGGVDPWADAAADGDVHGDGGAPPATQVYGLVVPQELLTKPAGPFDWGGGVESPGAHYLAIAILADLLGRGQRASIAALLPFLRRFLARLPKDGFEISDTVFYALFSAISAGVRAEVQKGNARASVGQQSVSGA
jgi:hypothetical protein